MLYKFQNVIEMLPLLYVSLKIVAITLEYRPGTIYVGTREDNGNFLIKKLFSLIIKTF